MNKSIESLIYGSSGGGSSIVGSNISSSEDIEIQDSIATVTTPTTTTTTPTTTTTTAEDTGLLDADMYADNDADEFTDENNQTKRIGETTSNLRRRKGKIMSCAKETIEHASRQLRRRVPYAGHLMTPRRLWLNKIPTLCDVVIEFPEDAPDEALRWLLARLRTQPPAGLGLVVQVKAHESMRRNAFYVSAPTNVLFKAAEEARLPKRLRPDLGGALREFTTRESHCFQQLKTDDGVTALFTSQERQWLVFQVLTGLRAGKSDIEALQGRAAVEEGQSIVAVWQETGLITQVFPLHETRSLTQLQSSWVRQIFAPQPLDDIAEYFGVKVALYFAWLGHYTCALGVPAIFGTILYVILWGKGQTAQDMGHVLFSLFNVAWASLYLEAWKRYSVELAFRWGTLSTPPELLEPPRPLYKGPLEENPVTGRLEPKEAPAWQRRAFRYCVSFPIIGLCLFLVFVVMFLMLRFQDWWDSKLPEDSIICCLSVIPKVLLAGAITLMDEAYYKLAVWLNDRENYRLQSKYENHLIAKVALFQFVNSFLSLFYIAFYLRDEEKLKEQLAGLLISRQIIGNLRESAIPYFIEQWKLAKLSFNMWGALSPTQDINRSIMDTDETAQQQQQQHSGSSLPSRPEQTSPYDSMKKSDGCEMVSSPTSTKTTTTTSTQRNIGQAEIESNLYKYDGTFSDHLEMLVQTGYVVLFSAAFPLAGVCALINNFMEIRSDAFKLAHVHQRPFGQRVANIGTWQNALSLLSLAAVIVNCALIGLSGQVSRLCPGLTTAQTIILIVTLEHIMLGLRCALTWLLPELPSWLAAEIARAEHCRREMQCKGTSPRPTPPTPPSTTSTQPEQEVCTNLLMGMSGGRVGAKTTNAQSLESQMADELLYRQQEQHQHGLDIADEIAQFGLQRNVEADVNIYENRDSSPDSPPSQTSTILIRPLHESTPPTSGTSLTSLNHDLSHGHAGASASSASTLALTTRQQPMHIPDIPPFRKKSNDSATGSTSSSSPQRTTAAQQRQSAVGTPPTAIMNTSAITSIGASKISEIPPFKPRKISAESATHLNMSELQNNTESTDILKPAPSWSNVAMRPVSAQQLQQQQQQQIVASTSSSSGGATTERGSSAGSNASSRAPAANAGSETTASARPSVGGISTTSTTSQNGKQPPDQTAASTSGTKNSIANSDDEAKAAELAAKKSRLKQKLVKSARSVAIFSLKLKERRQREAEKAATIAIEHAKQLAKMPPIPPPGGELSLIPIEQLIQIDDIKPATPKGPAPSSTGGMPTTSSGNTMQQSMSSSSGQTQHHHHYYYHPSSGHY